ncbi:uncharacterized protein LOC105663549 isoform X1 [Megachile rotundata]|uniref:uncharacterized protein LOC105663549 isoform X1 n=1 Tax=Megachile rotundata TaxID=143995 RepID=UPI003FD5BE92
MKKYQLLFLIVVFYYTQTYKCGIICAKCNKMQLFDPVKGPDLYNYHRVRAERGIKASNIDSKLVEKSRVPRGTESKHLRLGDAHQIANYFLTGGPLKGHAHFTRSSDCDSNNTETNIVGMSNPISENSNSTVNEENPSTNGSDPITGAVHIPALPIHKPIVQPPNLYKPPALPPLHALPLIPHIPHHSFLGSILHPRFHPHINTLHNIPSALVKAASMPVHGLLQAQSHLHDILKPQGLTGGSPLLGSTNKMSKRAKARKNSGNNLTYLMGQDSPIVGASRNGFNKIHRSNTPLSQPTHPQPTGYIVRYVPHNKESEPSSPIVGATQKESAANVDNNSDAGKNVTDCVNDKDQDVN